MILNLVSITSRSSWWKCRLAVTDIWIMASNKRPSGSDSQQNGTPDQKKIKTNGEAAAPVDFLDQVRNKRIAAGTSVTDFKFNKKRVRILSDEEDVPDECKGVVYWMSRDQRVQDNWAFLYAQRLAMKLEVPLHVCFCLVPKFLEATIRHFGFMLKGLKEVEQECHTLDISFHLLIGYAKDVLPKFVSDHELGAVITDFSPLRTPKKWTEDVKEALPDGVALCQVDAHNVVPCWEASPKQEYAARTIRPKITKQLETYLSEFPPIVKHSHSAPVKAEIVDWDKAYESLQVDRTVTEVEWATPGAEGGLRNLESFIKERLKHFGTARNNPNKSALSNMSPWFHFGQVSVQRAVLMVRPYRSRYSESVASFIEESIVRRELSDNFCYYNPNYDSIEGASDWAKKSLEDHKGDKRRHVYSREKLEKSKTHDDLWNAAQYQMVTEGKMHGFLRMYWAKKILEWTESPERALEETIYLNDRFNLDGRDPNGYVGCMWSICGIHDMGWKERDIFGKIRFMNYDGCKRKFDVPAFVRKYKPKNY